MSFFCDDNDEVGLGKRPNFRYIMQRTSGRTGEQQSLAEDSEQVRPSGVLFRNLKRVRHGMAPDSKAKSDLVSRTQQTSQQLRELHRSRYLNELNKYKSQMDYFN